MPCLDAERLWRILQKNQHGAVGSILRTQKKAGTGLFLIDSFEPLNFDRHECRRCCAHAGAVIPSGPSK